MAGILARGLRAPNPGPIRIDQIDLWARYPKVIMSPAERECLLKRVADAPAMAGSSL
jgi:hypothetical protein